MHLNWNWNYLSSLKDIDLKFVIENDTYDWNIKKICSNSKINWKLIFSNLEFILRKFRIFKFRNLEALAAKVLNPKLLI